jgi:hypothetical protein
MFPANPVRRCLCSLLCLGITVSTLAQTQPSTSAKKPADTSATHSTTTYSTTTSSTKKTVTAKAKQPASAHGTASHSPTHASAKTSTRTSALKSKIAQGKKVSKQVAKKRGQQAIDSERSREIQTALIREHYMDGEPSGSWDSSTQAAMQRYQADQGWQSKTTPDARALIKLGLGPSQDHLLNPESAMTLTPRKPATTPAPAAPAPDNPKTAAKPAPPQNDLTQQ